MTVRFDDVRDVGFFLFAAGWIVVVFVNSGVITGSLKITLGVDIIMAGLLALKVERAERTAAELVSRRGLSIAFGWGVRARGMQLTRAVAWLTFLYALQGGKQIWSKDMTTQIEIDIDKAEVAKVVYEMWRHENDIVNQKIAIFFAAQSILMVALASSPLTTSIVGLVISVIWLVSIGRTVAYRIHWRTKIDNLLQDTQDAFRSAYLLFPAREEQKRMPWYGRVPSNIVLIGTPLLGISFWFINLVYYL